MSGTDLEKICAIITGLDTGLEPDRLRCEVAMVILKPFQERQVLDELTARPDLLTGAGAYGSPRIIALLDALLAAGARGVTAPSCPFCGQVVPLRFRRDAARCCRRCYDEARKVACSRCGRTQSVVVRTEDGQPVCGACKQQDPVWQHNCADCGRLAPTRTGPEGTQQCKRCFREPIATCSECGKDKPCQRTAGNRPRCLSCARMARKEACDRCGVITHVARRTESGAALCGECGRRREPCSNCGRNLRVIARPAAEPLCRNCYRKDPSSFRPCVRCGTIERLYHHGLCNQCAADAWATRLLSGPDGQVRPELLPVLATLAAGNASTVLDWLEREGPRSLLIGLAAACGPVTHDTLDVPGEVRLLPARRLGGEQGAARARRTPGLVHQVAVGPAQRCPGPR